MSDPITRLNAALECLSVNRRVPPLILGSLLLPLGWGCSDDPTGPSDPLCSSQPATAIPTFEDANLEAAIRAGLEVGAQDDLTCGLLSELTVLDAPFAGITSLMGIQNLTSLTDLILNGNSISDIGALSGLTSVTFLGLALNSISDIGALSGLTSLTGLDLIGNLITDISALSGLTGLTFLALNNNPDLSNIQPLLDNTGLGAGDEVDLSSTNVSCADVDALIAKAVTVVHDCP